MHRLRPSRSISSIKSLSKSKLLSFFRLGFECVVFIRNHRPTFKAWLHELKTCLRAIQGNITRSILLLILPGNDIPEFLNFQQYLSCNNIKKILRIHTNMNIDPLDREKYYNSPPSGQAPYWYGPFGHYSFYKQMLYA